MHPAEPPTESADQEEKMPCIAFLLHVVRTLLGYGKHLDETLPQKTDHHRFPTIAGAFGTYDLRLIFGHIQRGILKAMMLERFLLARAAQGRDIEPTQPPAPAEAKDIEGLELKLRPASKPRVKAERRAPTNPDDPLNFYIPTLKELEAQIRRQPVGQTIAEICLDLGITPSFCQGATWSEILRSMMHFGANLEKFFDVQKQRRKNFEREWDRMPMPVALVYDWQDKPREMFRQIFGFLIGEPPPPEAVPASA